MKWKVNFILLFCIMCIFFPVAHTLALLSHLAILDVWSGDNERVCKSIIHESGSLVEPLKGKWSCDAAWLLFGSKQMTHEIIITKKGKKVCILKLSVSKGVYQKKRGFPWFKKKQWMAFSVDFGPLEVAESPDEVPCPAPHSGHRGGALPVFWSCPFFFSFRSHKNTRFVLWGEFQTKYPFAFKNQAKMRCLPFWFGFPKGGSNNNIPSLFRRFQLLWIRWHSEEWCNLPRPDNLWRSVIEILLWKHEATPFYLKSNIILSKLYPICFPIFNIGGSNWLVFWSFFMSETIVFLGLFAWSINVFRTWKTLTGESAHTGPAVKTRRVWGQWFLMGNHTVPIENI